MPKRKRVIDYDAKRLILKASFGNGLISRHSRTLFTIRTISMAFKINASLVKRVIEEAISEMEKFMHTFLHQSNLAKSLYDKEVFEPNQTRRRLESVMYYSPLTVN